LTKTIQKSRFRAGSGGVCEASLYEFTGRSEMAEETVRVAATSLEEALAYVRKRHSGLQVTRVEFLGMARLLSGSPVD